MPSYTDASIVSAYSLTGNKFFDSLLYSKPAFRYKWSTVTDGKTAITYSFRLDGVSSKFASGYGTEPTAATHGAMPSAQIDNIKAAFQAWANVANITFTQVSETESGTVGDIRVAQSSSVSGQHGAIADRLQWRGQQPRRYLDLAQLRQRLLCRGHLQLHGHDARNRPCLGLDHPFEGNKIPSGYDARNYTIMSYTDPKNVWWAKCNRPGGIPDQVADGLRHRRDPVDLWRQHGYNAGDTTYTYSATRRFSPRSGTAAATTRSTSAAFPRAADRSARRHLFHPGVRQLCTMPTTWASPSTARSRMSPAAAAPTS
jgi:serralysin